MRKKRRKKKLKKKNEKNELQSTNKLYIIDSKFIGTEGKINLKNKLFCYKTLNYAGKKYILTTKKKSLNYTNLISYYCSLHRTTKFTNEFDKNNKKKKICYVMVKLYMIKKPMVII